MPNPLENFTSIIDEIASCKDITCLLAVMDDFFVSIGVKYYNYIHHMETSSNYFLHHNYNISWVQRYIKREYASIDPVVINAKLNNQIISWSEACNEIKSFTFGKSKKALIQDMIIAVKNEELENGLAVPIISEPYKQYGFYLAFFSSQIVNDFRFRNIINAICVMFNNAFINFEKHKGYGEFYNKNEKFPFSERECQLIKLIYLGKERTDIAELMNVSINTVDTMTKRLFLKMRVNTKVQLITKTITKGWVFMFSQ